MTGDTQIPEMTEEQMAAYAAVGAFGLVDVEGRVQGASGGYRILQTLGGIDSARYTMSTPRMLHAVWMARKASADAGMIAAGRTAGRRIPLISLGAEGISQGPSGLWEGTTNLFSGIGTGTRRIWNAGVNYARGNADWDTTQIEACDGAITYYESIGRSAANVAGTAFLGSPEAGRGVQAMLNLGDPAARERGWRLFANNNPVTAIRNAVVGGEPIIVSGQGLDANQLRNEVFRELGVSSMLDLNDFRGFKEKMLAKLRAYKAPGREGEITHINTPAGNILLDDAIAMTERLPDELPPPIVALKARLSEVSARRGGDNTQTVSAGSAAGRTDGGALSGSDEGLFSQFIAWITRQFDRISSWFSGSSAPTETPRVEATTAAVESRTRPAASGYEDLGTIRPLTVNINPTLSSDGPRGVNMEGAR